MRLAAVSEDRARSKDRFDLVDGILESRTGTAEDDDHTHLRVSLYELTGRKGTQKRRVRTHSTRSVKERAKKGAARLGAKEKMIRDSIGSRSSSSAALEESAVRESLGERIKVAEGSASRYGEVQGEGNSKAWCLELDGAWTSARTVQRSSDSDSADEMVLTRHTAVRIFRVR